MSNNQRKETIARLLVKLSHDKFAMGLPADYRPTVKLPTILKAAIWKACNVETQIKEKGLEKTETGEKTKFEGYSRSYKKSRF